MCFQRRDLNICTTAETQNSYSTVFISFILKQIQSDLTNNAHSKVSQQGYDEDDTTEDVCAAPAVRRTSLCVLSERKKGQSETGSHLLWRGPLKFGSNFLASPR